jgi:hypothetical protein
MSLAVFAQPPLTATHTIIQPTCYGAPNGSIQESITGGTSPYTIVCNGDTTSSIIHGLVGGTYYITIYDGASSIFRDTVIVSSPPAVNVQIEIYCVGDSTLATVFASGGTPPYQFSWTYDGLDFLFGDSVILYNDTIRNIASDNFGCTYATDTIVNLCAPLAVSDLDAALPLLYPNPATNQLFVESDLPIAEVNIYSTSGLLVMCINNSDGKNINITQLPTGIYFAEIKMGNASIKKRWVKQ